MVGRESDDKALGRALRGDFGFRAEQLHCPDFARQLQEHGRLERTRVCRTFSYCTALMRAKHNELGQFATGCPPFDKEVYGPMWAQAKEPGSTSKDKGAI